MESVQKSSRSILAAISTPTLWIDENLLPEILKRLPAKSLCRFSSVCKRWKSLISSALLIDLHYSFNSSINPINLKPYIRRRVIRDDDYALCRPQLQHVRHILRFPFQFRPSTNPYFRWDYKRFDFVDLIHGVVCLTYKVNVSNGCTLYYAILWNPTIHKYVVTLPCQQFHVPGSKFYNSSVGFGYDISKNDFHVVILRSFNSSTQAIQPDYDVYSTRERRWKTTIAKDIIKFSIYDGTATCFVNGHIHWLVMSKHDLETYYVLMFDCERQEFRTIKLPQERFSRRIYIATLLEYAGMLSVLVSSVVDTERELWVMEVHGVASTWKILYRIYEDREPYEIFYSNEVSSNVTNIHQSSFRELSPYGPDEWIKFRWNDELVDDIVCNYVYDESLVLMDDTKALSYTKEEIIYFDVLQRVRFWPTCDPFVIPVQDKTHVSTVVAGTFGYLAPEYFDSGRATSKGDVYSYGVVLLEILTGKRPMDDVFLEEGTKLVTWVKTVIVGKREEQVVDSRLDSYAGEEVTRVFSIAMMCLEEEPSKRPTMTDVVKMLEHVRNQTLYEAS